MLCKIQTYGVIKSKYVNLCSTATLEILVSVVSLAAPTSLWGEWQQTPPPAKTSRVSGVFYWVLGAGASREHCQTSVPRAGLPTEGCGFLGSSQRLMGWLGNFLLSAEVPPWQMLYNRMFGHLPSWEGAFTPETTPKFMLMRRLCPLRASGWRHSLPERPPMGLESEDFEPCDLQRGVGGWDWIQSRDQLFNRVFITNP